MPRLLRLIGASVVLLLCTACAQLTYQKTGKGQFAGDLDVRWSAPDCFIYIPSTTNPLRLTTADNKVITPAAMVTDGGSVPRILWGIPGLSPWGYAPAYIVHDWLFEAHHQGLPEYSQITFERSAEVLAEGIKTLMETHPDVAKDETILWAIYEAVRTPVARALWDKTPNRERTCGASMRTQSLGQPPGILLFKVRLG